MFANMTNEKERLHRFRFPDSVGPLDFVSPGNIKSALLSNIVYREGFSEFKQNLKSLIKFPTYSERQSLPRPGNEDRMIMVESFAICGCVVVGISLIK